MPECWSLSHCWRPGPLASSLSDNWRIAHRNCGTTHAPIDTYHVINKILSKYGAGYNECKCQVEPHAEAQRLVHASRRKSTFSNSMRWNLSVWMACTIWSIDTAVYGSSKRCKDHLPVHRHQAGVYNMENYSLSTNKQRLQSTRSNKFNGTSKSRPHTWPHFRVIELTFLANAAMSSLTRREG